MSWKYFANYWHCYEIQGFWCRKVLLLAQLDSLKVVRKHNTCKHSSKRSVGNTSTL